MRAIPQVLQVVTTTQRRGAEVFRDRPRRRPRGATGTWPPSPWSFRPPEGHLDVPALGSAGSAPASLAELRDRASDVDVVVAPARRRWSRWRRAPWRTPFVYRSVRSRAWTPAACAGCARRCCCGRPRRSSSCGRRRPRSSAPALGSGATRIAVIPNGVPASRCHVAAAEGQRRLAAPPASDRGCRRRLCRCPQRREAARPLHPGRG